jgi:hypothetical protein
MLALYGESFTQNSLRNFNYYYSSQEIDEVIVRNKLEYLKNIVSLNRDRAAAADYFQEMWNSDNVSGLQNKACRLLGFRYGRCRSLTRPIRQHNLRLVSQRHYIQMREKTPELCFFPYEEKAEQGEGRFASVPFDGMSSGFSAEQLRREVHTILPLGSDLLNDELLRGGVSIDRYKIVYLDSTAEYQLLFECTEEVKWWCLGRYRDEEQAIRAANGLRRFLIDLNAESEGMHIVEHILLRPVGQDRYEDLCIPDNFDFYSLRLSVIFPAWTARCHDPRFRSLAEETVRLNCPAHICPQFYWLDFAEMVDFEQLYKQWQRGVQEWGLATGKGREAANKLVRFLLHHGHPGSTEQQGSV